MYKDGKPHYTIDFNEGDKEDVSLKELPEDAKRNISEEEIKDRGKADVLAKGLALLQTSWFILQCISRRIEGLPTTSLEIATIAFAALNFTTYIFWWNKPLNVGCPVRVYETKDPEKKVQEETSSEGQSVNKDCDPADNRNGDGADDRKLENSEKENLWTTFIQGLADIPKEAWRPFNEVADKQSVWWITLLLPVFTKGNQFPSR